MTTGIHESAPPGGWEASYDYPESAWPSDSSWRPQVLRIAIIAPETDFERALEEAAPIVESLEFCAG
jgi:hypothetical protein